MKQKGPTCRQAGFAHIFLILFLLAGLAVGVYLVQQKTNILPKASGPTVTTPTTSFELSPANSSDNAYNVGDLIPVNVRIRSDISAANLFNAKITFDKDLLAVDNIRTDNSFVKNWVENTFDNNAGTISLVGGVPTPGYKTDNNSENQKYLLMAIIHFKVLKSGSAAINLTDDSAIYSNADNINILAVKTGAVIKTGTGIVQQQIPTSPQPLPSGNPDVSPSAGTSISLPPSGSLDSPQTIKVLVLNYFPLNPLDNTRLDGTKMGSDFANVTLTSIRATANSELQNLRTKLAEGSKYHGYKDPGATPYLSFTVVDNKEFLKKIPQSTTFCWWNNGLGANICRPNYFTILQGEDFNICDYVDHQGVTQVWLRSYHYPRKSSVSQEPDESNMAMGRVSQSFWNWGSYGDVSNSQHFNDMPVCNKTYTLFGYGGLGNTLENHLHHIENLFIFADFASNSEKLFRKMPEDNRVGYDTFERPLGLGSGAVNHCGNVHNPPNSTIAYDWFNETTVKSDCMDWKPDGGGQVTDVNCHTWYPGVAGLCRPVDDGGAKFKIWLMQNYAGYQNTLTYQGKRLRNWWEFYADFDAALARGKSLTVQKVGGNSNIGLSVPAPTSAPGFISSTVDALKRLIGVNTPTPAPTATPILTPTPAAQVVSDCKPGTLGTGDANGDGKVDLKDLSVLLSNFGKTSGFNQAIDMNGDCTINTFDVLLMRKILIEKGVIKG